jgi:hypothetical protein
MCRQTGPVEGKKSETTFKQNDEMPVGYKGRPPFLALEPCKANPVSEAEWRPGPGEWE